MAAGITEQMASALARDRSGLVHASTADRVTELLRTHIMEGLFPPGTRLSEEVIGQALGVSRNTLREAFRLLCHERLAVHQMNRGIFVPVLSRADVTDIYALRRLVEGGAARMAGSAAMTARLAVRAAVDAAEAAAAAGRWFEVRTADLLFHQAVAALAGSPRVDELMRRALAELRLIFHAMADPEEFHAPYVARNRVIAESVMLGDGEAAEKELLAYLADAERQLLAVYRVPAPDAAREVPAGPGALLVEVDTLGQVRALYARIEAERAAGWAAGLTEVVPAARTILLDGVADQAAVQRDLRSWPVVTQPPASGPVTEIGCRYDGPDLAAVAELWGVPPGEVAAVHGALEHEVAFCGFAPGFPYIAGLGGGREVPRRDSPRAVVPAGSLALAGEYTGIYPRASPGGWQLIGRTDAVMWDPDREPAALLQPGDRVRFTDLAS